MLSLSILLCGYGWFAGIPEGETNNAELIARALDGETLVCGDVRATVRGMTMPVLWHGAFEPVQAAIDAQKPNEWFVQNCSHVLDNGGTLADFQRRCHQLIQEVLS